jgi:hypothetical protein
MLTDNEIRKTKRTRAVKDAQLSKLLWDGLSAAAKDIETVVYSDLNGIQMCLLSGIEVDEYMYC